MEPTTPPPEETPPPPGPELVDGRVRPPAIALVVTAIVGIVLNLMGLILHLVGLAPSAAGAGADSSPPWDAMFVTSGVLGLVQPILGLVMGGLVLYAAIQMMNRRNWGLSLAGAIVAMVPLFSPCCLLGLPFGIWAVVILSQSDVKAAFH